MTDAQKTSIPDTLFKYVSADGGLATLQERAVSVMFSKPSDLNHPFEFLPRLDKLAFTPDELKGFEYLASPFLSATADYLRHEIELHWFVTSFTKTDRNVRMWDQYGGNHTGIKLTFNLASSEDLKAQKKEWMRRVQYLDGKRIDISKLCKSPPLSEKQRGNLLQRIATRKGRDWEHEEEVRWFLRDNDHAGPDKQLFEKKLVDGTIRAFMKLPHECIQRVTVGYRSPPSLLWTVLELKKMHQAPWKVTRTVLSLNSFRFNEELIPCGE